MSVAAARGRRVSDMGSIAGGRRHVVSAQTYLITLMAAPTGNRHLYSHEREVPG
jgi:hypothetical protein